jgi:hypothetical protein
MLRQGGRGWVAASLRLESLNALGSAFVALYFSGKNVIVSLSLSLSLSQFNLYEGSTIPYALRKIGNPPFFSCWVLTSTEH